MDNKHGARIRANLDRLEVYARQIYETDQPKGRRATYRLASPIITYLKGQASELLDSPVKAIEYLTEMRLDLRRVVKTAEEIDFLNVGRYLGRLRSQLAFDLGYGHIQPGP